MKKIFLTVLSVCSFLYYLWLGVNNHFHLSVLSFWLLLSILLLLLGYGAKLPFADRVPRPARRIFTLCLAAGAVLFLAAEGAVLWGMTRQAPTSTDLNYLIVLGAGVNGDRPSHTLELRLICALDYLNAHPGTKVVVSGGQGSSESVSEAESMYLWLTENGIASNRILLEDNSTTTAENMQFSLPLIQADSGSEELSIGIVTSNFHIFRSLCLASHAADMRTEKQTAYDLYGLPADFPLPALPHYMVREFFTICVDTWLGNMNFIP